MKPQPVEGPTRKIGHIGPKLEEGPMEIFRTWLDRTSEGKSLCEHDYNPQLWRCPYGVPDDRLWMKEAWQYVTLAKDGDLWTAQVKADGRYREMPDGQPVMACYKADGDSIGAPWKSGRFMPKWVARPQRLEIVKVRAERVQDITLADVYAEGLRARLQGGEEAMTWFMRKAFAITWDKLNGKRAPWASNPWVWVIEWPPVKS